MPEVNYSVALPVLPERVWGFVTDVRLWPAWLEGVTTVRALTLPNMQAGLRFEVLRVGQSAAETWIVAEWDARRHVRFTEYRENIQLEFDVTTVGTATELGPRVAFPRSRGLLGNVLNRAAPGARWAQALKPSLVKLKDIFVFNRDNPRMHG